MAPKKPQQEIFVDKFLKATYSSSIITPEEVNKCKNRLNLPDRYLVRKPKADEFPNSKLNPNEMIIYFDQIRLGLTFSKLPMLDGILNHYKMSLAMVTPNFVCTVILIYYFCQIRSIPWSIDVYLHLFSLRGTHSYVASKSRKKTFTTHGLTSSIHGWKLKYVIVQAPQDWTFPNYPEIASEDVLQAPKCPQGLQEWFKRNPLPFYIVDNKTKDLMTGREAAILIQKKVTSSSKKRRIEKMASTSRAANDSSPEINLEDDPDRETSSSSGNHSGSFSSAAKSEEVKIVDSDEATEQATRPTTQVPPPYYINSAGDLVFKKGSDIKLLEEPCNPLGPLLFKYLECPSEIKKYDAMSSEVLEQIFSNSMITVGRLGRYFLQSALVNSNTAEKCKKVYDAARSDLDKAKDKIISLEQGEGSSTAKKLEMVTAELKVANECLDAAMKTYSEQDAQNKKLIEENLKLKEALAKKDEVSAPQSVGEASTSGKTMKERFEEFKDTPVYNLAMDDFLNQGFEKFRRATFRRFKNDNDVATLKSIDYYVANDEDFVDLAEMMAAEDEAPKDS